MSTLRNNKTAIKVIKYMMGEGFNVLVAMITPFQEIRDLVKKEVANCIEVYLSCPESVRKTRPNFRASQIKYEVPAHPDIIIKTDEESIEESVEKVLQFIRRQIPTAS